MPTSYPTSNDTFKAPDNPNAVVTASAGDSTRNHAQSHQDMGDAIMALEANSTLLPHDHSGTGSRPTEQLNQANTHQNSDTDSGPTALHHTIGSSANQAAAGNHIHYTPYFSRANFGSASNFYTNPANVDTVWGPGWVATDDTYNLFTAGSNPEFTIPANGKWLICGRAIVLGTSTGGAYGGMKILKNQPTGAFSNAYVIGGDSRLLTAFDNPLQVGEVFRLAQNDTIKMDIFTNITINVIANAPYIGDSYMSITYLGP